MSRRLRLLLVVPLIALLCGCAGARPKLRFDGVRYPVSMSQFLLDAEGQVVEPDDLAPLGIYSFEQTGYAIGYSQLQLSRLDLSKSINQRIEELGGEAIIQLEITAKKSPCLTANTIAFGLNLIPLYPGCSGVFVQGIVVERKKPPKGAGVPPRGPMVRIIASGGGENPP